MEVFSYQPAILRFTVRTIPKSTIKIVERDRIDTANTQIHDRSLSWLGTGMSIKTGRVKLALWV
jgi:hypothetical protein